MMLIVSILVQFAGVGVYILGTSTPRLSRLMDVGAAVTFAGIVGTCAAQA